MTIDPTDPVRAVLTRGSIARQHVDTLEADAIIGVLCSVNGHERRLGELTDRNVQLAADLEGAIRTNTRLTDQLEHTIGVLEETRNLLAFRNDELDATRRDLAGLEQQREHAETKWHELAGKLTEAVRQLEDADRKIEQLQARGAPAPLGETARQHIRDTYSRLGVDTLPAEDDELLLFAVRQLPDAEAAAWLRDVLDNADRGFRCSTFEDHYGRLQELQQQLRSQADLHSLERDTWRARDADRARKLAEAERKIEQQTRELRACGMDI